MKLTIADNGFCPVTLGGYSVIILFPTFEVKVYGIDKTTENIFFSYKENHEEFFMKSWELEDEDLPKFTEVHSIILETLEKEGLLKKSIELYATYEELYNIEIKFFEELTKKNFSTQELIEFKDHLQKIKDIIHSFKINCFLSEEDLLFLTKIKEGSL